MPGSAGMKCAAGEYNGFLAWWSGVCCSASVHEASVARAGYASEEIAQSQSEIRLSGGVDI